MPAPPQCSRRSTCSCRPARSRCCPLDDEADRRPVPRRHARRLRRVACLHGAGGAAPNLCRDGAAHLDRAHPLPWRESGGLHGRRLCARAGEARRGHGAGWRRAQSPPRPARCVSRALPGDRLHRRPRPELVQLAEALGIPVATSLNAKDCMPAAHPLSVGVVGSYSRESANRVVAAADLVCFIGTSAGGMTTHAWAVPKIGVAAVQIDIEPQTLGRNYPLKAAVLGDVKASLSLMLESCDPRSMARRTRWIEQVQKICSEWRQKYRPALESDAVPIRPERICAELSRHVPEDAIVLSDTGHAGMWMGGMYDVRGPRQSFMRSAGHLGWAFPAGPGAKFAAPGRPVVTFTGDAGLWYHIGEIETAVRWNIAAVTVGNNNASGNQSKRGFDRVYGGEQTPKARELWTYRMVDFARVAGDIGAFGIRVERAAEFPGALEEALKSGKPAIIDVVTDIEAIAPLAVSS